LNKILVVFVTAASIAFLGIAVGISKLGPNWREETQNLSDYTFAQTAGETPQWTSTQRTEGQPLATAASLPNVISKSYDDAARRNQEKTAAVTPQIENLKQQIARISELIKADELGIAKREEQLALALEDVGKQIQALSTDGERLATQAVEIRAVAERTRESGMRLKRQRIQIETDLFRLTDQKRHLLDLVYQMEGILQRLRDREQQLIDQGAVPVEAAPTAETAST
jgi:chromosome segregation ATPase